MKSIENKNFENIKEQLEKADGRTRDEIYRYLMCTYVKEDVESFIENRDYTLSEEQIDNVVELYVYQCRYDCNLSYWDNIENLVLDIIKK